MKKGKASQPKYAPMCWVRAVMLALGRKTPGLAAKALWPEKATWTLLQPYYDGLHMPDLLGKPRKGQSGDIRKLLLSHPVQARWLRLMYWMAIDPQVELSELFMEAARLDIRFRYFAVHEGVFPDVPWQPAVVDARSWLLQMREFMKTDDVFDLMDIAAMAVLQIRVARLSGNSPARHLGQTAFLECWYKLRKRPEMDGIHTSIFEHVWNTFCSNHFAATSPDDIRPEDERSFLVWDYQKMATDMGWPEVVTCLATK